MTMMMPPTPPLPSAASVASVKHILAVSILSLCLCKQSQSWNPRFTVAKTRASSAPISSSPLPSTKQLFLSLSPSWADEIGTSMEDQHLSRNNYRVAVVTGASRGIGRGIAYELGLDKTTSWVVYCVGRSTRRSGDNLGGKHQLRKSWFWPIGRRRQRINNESEDESDPPPPSQPQTIQLLDDQRPVDPTLDLSVESIAEEISSSSSPPSTNMKSSTKSIGIPVPCDLSDDESIAAIFDQVRQRHGRLDLLVCSAYTTPPQRPPGEPGTDATASKATSSGLRGNFWDQSMDMWDAVNGIGLRQVYACCREAAPLMIETAAMNATEASSPPSPPPLICFVSSFGGKSYTFNVAYGVGKAGVDRMALDMSYQLSKFGVATTTLYPGLVRTEANMQMELDGTWDEASGGLDLSQGETPRFSGRALVQLTKLSKDEMMKRSGQVEVVAELAREFGFTDIDQSRPPSIRSLRYLLPNFVFPSIEKESDQPIPEWIKNNVPDILLPWSVFSSGPPPEMDKR